MPDDAQRPVLTPNPTSRARGASGSKSDKRPSLRLRIAAAVAAFALMAILAQAGALLLVLNEQEEEFIDEILNRQATRSLESYRHDPAAALPNSPRMRLYRLPGDGRSAQPPALFARLPIGNHEVHEGGTEYHVAVRSQDGARFFLAYDVGEHEKRLETIVFLTIAGALAIGALILASVYALAGRLTRRLDRLARRVTDPDFRGPYAEPDMEREVLAVANALDGYGARQAQLLARERDFSANLSHELRTPLTAVRTDAELLAALPGLPEAARMRARRIVDTVDHITDLAHSLLVLAREAEPKLVEEVNLAQALRAAWEPLAGRAREKELVLVAQIAAATTVLADASLLALTLRNLLDNAVRHSAQGIILCRLDGTQLVVQDCGPGLAAGQAERVFERFYRGEAGRHGLGLALVKHVCEACGWGVSAGNAPEGGARLAIDFGAALRPGAASQLPHTFPTTS
jgi:signal transduction histidine kinase